MGDINEISQFKSFHLSMKDAVYNPKLGIMNLKLEETEIGGVRTSLTHIFLDPNTKVQPHLHEHGGEIVQTFSPVTIYLGNPVKAKNGEYQMDGDKIVVKWNEPIQMHSGDSLRLAQGTAHSFCNFSEEPAHIQFVLPTNHFEADKKGNIDSRLCTLPEKF